MTATLSPPIQRATTTPSERDAVDHASPWHPYAAVFAAACVMVGVYWDISWHMSIGRDTFWTPAHLLIQAGGIIAGGAGATLIFTTTFRREAPLRAALIGVWGFRGQLGEILAGWGAATVVA